MRRPVDRKPTGEAPGETPRIQSSVPVPLPQPHNTNQRNVRTNGAQPPRDTHQDAPTAVLTDTHTARPEVLAPIFDNFPQELVNSPRWVLWRLELVKGKWTKPPYQISGRKASTTDASTWATFEQVQAEYKKHPGRWSGVGWVVGHGIVGVDIDHCRDPETGELTPEAAHAVELLDTYTEPSPSGAGIRLLGQGELPDAGSKRGDFEAYGGDGGRYLTVTGHRLPNVRRTIEQRTEQLAEFHARHIAAPSKAPCTRTTTSSATTTADLADDDVLTAAFASRNGATIKALYDGDTTAHGGDHSAADLALAGHLAWWSDYDHGQTDRLFRRSQLMREKWDEPHYRDGTTYGAATINRAAEGKRPGDGYQPPRKSERTTGEVTATNSEDTDDEAPDEPKAKSAATLLVDMALAAYDFGSSDDGTPYATPKTGPLITYLLRGGRESLRAVLSLAYFRKYAKAASQQALADALGTLDGLAREVEPRRLYQRVGSHDGALWLDLGDNTGRAVRITPGAWSVENRPPVLFRRTPLSGALPLPDPTGTIAELWQHLRIPEEDRPLVLAYLVSVLYPDMAHPILYFSGQQDGGKTTAAKQIVCLLDVGPVPYRKAPRDADSFVTAATGSWIIALDNLSTVPDWLSDSLCRAVTGEGDVRRRLYSDGDLAVFSFRRCIILVAIDVGSLNGDLADRLLPIPLSPIEPEERATEEQIWSSFKAAHPRLLGAVLNLAASVASVLPTLHLDEMPRMAEYARILAAIDKLHGTDGLTRYLGTQGRLAADTLTGDPFTSAIVETFTAPFEGTSAQLLEAVTPDSEKWKRPKEWPANARAVTQRMRRQAPVLRKIGWTVTDDAGANKSNALLWYIAPAQEEERGEKPSPHSPHSPTGQEPRAGRNGDGELSASMIQAASIANSPHSPPARVDNSPDSPHSPNTRHENPVQDAQTSMASMARQDYASALLARCMVTATDFATLDLEALRERLTTALPHANAQSWWTSLAVNEPLAVTVAVYLLAEDRATDSVNVPPSVYLQCARQAVAALTTKDG